MEEVIISTKSVEETNWADPTIERAGICLFYRFDSKSASTTFIGFGINNYSGIISPLGGSFEENDHDLLSTAIREYNKEVGQNFPNLTEESVSGKLASFMF